MHASPPPSVLMDKVYRKQRYIYDLTRKFFLLGRDQLVNRLDVPDNARVLEIGCGTARNLIFAAKKYPGGHFYGVDISSEMLKSARHKVTRHKAGKRITLAQGNAVNFDPHPVFATRCFERIFLSYTLSMIGPWQQTVEHGVELLAPGGSLHIVDFSQQSKLPVLFKTVLNKWLEKFHVEPCDELEGFILSLAKKQNLQVNFNRIYRDYACLATLTKPSG